MPVYNVEKYVKESMLSVLEQTYDNIELLIVDDCGTDNSMIIAKSVINEYKGNKTIRIINHSTNKGLGEARNTAMKEAKGDYIYFIDSDDKITNDCIEILFSKMQKGNVDFVAASYQEIDEDGTESNEQKTLENITIKGGKKIKEYLFQDFGNRMNVTAWNKLYKCSFIKKHHLLFSPKVLYEDQIFNLVVCTHCESIVITADITYLYRQRKNSIMHYGVGPFSEKEIKDRANALKLSKLYICDYKSYNYFGDVLLQQSIRCYYFTKGYYEHNNEHLYIKPYIKDFLFYPIGITELFKRGWIFKKHIIFWSLSKCPYWIIRLLL
jgi:glycosyltransferase involved in cell wall biosynthesis